MKHTILALLLSLLAVACGSDPVDRLAEVRMALQSGDNAAAKKALDSMLQAKELTAPQLAELSMMYMQLSDQEEMEDNTTAAYQCFRNAFKADSLAAAAYFDTIPAEYARYADFLITLQQTFDNPRRNDIPDEEEGEDEAANLRADD